MTRYGSGEYTVMVTITTEELDREESERQSLGRVQGWISLSVHDLNTLLNHQRGRRLRANKAYHESAL